jgi:hypothetical protein
MENGMEKRKDGKISGAWLALLLPICWGLALGDSPAQELRFCSLKQGQYSLPSLPSPILLARSGSAKIESLSLAQEDYLVRMKRRPRLHEEIWSVASDQPKQATLCVIHNLTETAGLSFLIPSAKNTSAILEVLIPKGPELGSFTLSLNGKDLGTIDPWAREKTLPEWIPFTEPVALKQGNNALLVIQKSPQDLPIWLDSLRITE